jgi:hypothetical protein
MIETAPISLHAAIIPVGVKRYKENVVLITDWGVTTLERLRRKRMSPEHKDDNTSHSANRT